MATIAHYVTFLDALRTVSGIDKWEFGPPQKVDPPSELGDYPTPKSDGGTAVA